MSKDDIGLSGVLPTLREYIELRLDYERTLVAKQAELEAAALTHMREVTQLQFAHVVEARELKLDAMEVARKLQAVEYERRLTVLNHAHEAALQAQAMTVPRELWEQFIKEHDLFKTEVNKQLTAIATRSQTWALIIGLLFAVLNVLVRFWPSAFVVR